MIVLNQKDAIEAVRQNVRALGMIEIGESQNRSSTYHSLPGLKWTLRISDHDYDEHRRDDVAFSGRVSRGITAQDAVKRAKQFVRKFVEAVEPKLLEQ